MHHTFFIIGLIAEFTLKFISDTRSKIFENPVLETKHVQNVAITKYRFVELVAILLMHSHPINNKINRVNEY